MTERGARALRGAMVLVGVQGMLIAAYLGIEALRAEPRVFVVEALSEGAPPLEVVRDAALVAPPERAHLVHFWATWCAPCEEELPGLLAASEATGVPVLAVTDEPWPVVERHFGGEVPTGVVRDPSGEASAAWRVSGLPDTFVVRGGRVIGRMGGPRAWSTREARAYLSELRRSR